MWKRTLKLSLAALVLVATARADPPRKIDSFKPESGFIDDPLAFSSDGKLLAYITTDGATASLLHFVAPGGGAPAVACKYGSITPERIEFLDGDRALVVERNPDTRLVRGQIYTRQGVAKEKLGPASEMALGTVAGTPAIVTYLRTTKGAVATHTLAAFAREGLKPLGKRVLAEDATGRVTVAGKRMKPLFFEAGYTELIAQKEGDFDAKHDIRKPDAAARVDVFGGKLISEHEIADVIAWTVLTQERKKHPNESEFVQFNEDLTKLQVIDRDDRTGELGTPRPLRKYDPTTLASQPLEGGALAISLTVDPVNRDAVAAKKADQDWLDLFRLDVKARALTPIATIDGEKRPSGWRLGGTRIGVLRKHKGFARGGMELDVFDTAPPAPPPVAAPAAKLAPAAAVPPGAKASPVANPAPAAKQPAASKK